MMTVEPTISVPRILVFCLAVLVFYGVVVLRLWQEQILQESSHELAIARQSVRRIRIPAPRGRIYSRDGVVLADNYPAYNVVFHLHEMRQPGRAVRTIDYMLGAADRAARAIGRKHSLTERTIRNHMNYTPALPMTVFEALDQVELARISEMPDPIAGLEVVIEPRRRYVSGSSACHVIGYVRKDDPGQASDREDFFYYIPDESGREGLERFYDASIPESRGLISGLRGTPGSSLVMVDFRGIIHKTLGNTVPEKVGHDLILTLDSRAQGISENLLEGQRGAFVMLDAGSGAVVAMASSPGYDLSMFTPRLPVSYWNEIRSNPDRPLFNRATRAYEPGSIIKPLIGLALLENGMPLDEHINCPGRSLVGNASIRCAARSGHGELDLCSAIEVSCNVFFIEGGKVAGLEKLADTLSAFGVGKPTGIPLTESPGLLPSRSEYYHRTGRKWNVFETALISIGQGSLHVTPLQAALFTAALSNGGILWRPYLLKEVRDSGGNVIFITQPSTRAELMNIKGEYIELLKDGMFKAVHSSRGSGKNASTSKIQLYGKTGTAEVGHGESRRKNTWFVAYGSHEGRTYALALFIEDGVSGGQTCAPMVKEFFDSWIQ